MLSNNRFFAYNNSTVVGGQEAYLLLLKKSLSDYEVDFSIIGNPKSIASTDNIQDLKDNDFLVLNGNKSLYDLVLTKRVKQASVYIHHSDINDNQGPLYKKIIRKLLLYFCLKKVDAVIRVCNKCLPDKFAKEKIWTVYNGVELKTETPKKPGDYFNLLMVGAINDNKNQKLAIEALSYLDDVTLTFVGSGPDSEALKLIAIELGVGDRVQWAGFQNDPTPYYEQADLLLMLSKNEAFPFVVLEAMAHGVPIIAVPVGGVPEAVQHMSNGILLNDYRPESLAIAIQIIQENSELYTEFSQNAIKTIRNKFSLEKMTEGFLNVVKQVQEKRGLK
ncbi:glycosyltransferase family 4 protein [Vibrio cholerae]